MQNQSSSITVIFPRGLNVVYLPSFKYYILFHDCLHVIAISMLSH